MTKMVLIALLPCVCFGAFMAEITTTASELGGGRWQYSYEIANTGTEAIEQLTIWFDYSGYSNFEITTDDPGTWDEIMLAVNDILQIGAGYDILNTTDPLLSGFTLLNFSVAFDYDGAAPAIFQSFEIINPDTQATEFAGQTIPEPATIALLAAGAAAVGLKPRSKRK
jgi:hypothetical protein